MKNSTPMKVTVLGAGGAFAPISRGNSSFLIETGDRKILIDCGTTVPYILRDEMGIPLQSITDLIITHAHADHIGGLEQLIYSNKFMGDNPKPHIYALAGVGNEIAAAISPGLSWGQEGRLPETHYFQRARALKPGEVEDVGGIPLAFQSVPHCGGMPASAVRFGPLAVSGDTNVPEVCTDEGVELWFHEAEFGFQSGVHCPYEDLRLATVQSIRERMWLYHCPEDADPGDFAGILKKGQVFDLVYSE